MEINELWNDIINKNRELLPKYFSKDAIIRWHCTNEQFTVNEYIRANCDYPGNWAGEIERLEKTDYGIILVARVYSLDTGISCHVTSFIKIYNDKIYEMDEYWADDGKIPDWRKCLNIGRSIV